MTVTTIPRSRPAHKPGCRCTACRHKRHEGCGCAKCRRRAGKEAAEIDLETPSAVYKPPKIDSCDPGRHKFRKMHVVRWTKRRTPCRRNIPVDIDLGILSRARTRIPLSSVNWLIETAKGIHPSKKHWVQRLPRSHRDSIVDLTVELFIQQTPGMTLDQIRETFKSYLKQRHETELGARCDGGFFLFYMISGSASGKKYIETKFELTRFGLDLDRLYKRANVIPSKTKMCPGGPDELPARFFLLAYITLPDSMEARLRTPLPEIPKTRAGNKFFIDRIESVQFSSVDGWLPKYDELLCLRDLLADHYKGSKLDDLYYRFRKVQNWGVMKISSGHAVDFFERRCKADASIKTIEACLLKLRIDIVRNVNRLGNAIGSLAGDVSNRWELPECVYARDMIVRSKMEKPRSVYSCFRDYLADQHGTMCRLP